MKRLLLATAALLLSVSVAEASAPKGEPIDILDLSSYTAGAAFAEPTRQGFDMAAEEINAAGGVLGRPIHFEHVDDTGKPENAITKLQQAVLQKRPVMITGCNLENIALAVSDYAQHNKIIDVYACIGGNEAIWRKGHAYYFRGAGPTLYGINKMMALRAASRHKTKWAAINQNYAWGQENLAAFKETLGEIQPDASWVEEQWTPVGKIDAGAVVNALLRSGADAVYTSLWGSDLTQFLREAKKRGLTSKAIIVGDNIGRPEFMAQMKGEMPAGLITTGTLPYEVPVTPAMKAFAERYQKRYGQEVRYTALLSYTTAYMIASAIEKTGSTKTEDLIAKMPGMQLDGIFGPYTLRAIDHVPTNGLWVGETAVKDGKPVLVNVEYRDAKDYFPPDAYIEKLRK